MYTIYASIALGLAYFFIGAICSPYPGFTRDSWLRVLASTGLMLSCFCSCLFAGFVVPHYMPRHLVVQAPVVLVPIHGTDAVGGPVTFLVSTDPDGYYYKFFTRNANGSLSPAAVRVWSGVSLIDDQKVSDAGYLQTTVEEYDLSSSLASWTFMMQWSYPVKYEFHLPADKPLLYFEHK